MEEGHSVLGVQMIQSPVLWSSGQRVCAGLGEGRLPVGSS